MSLHVTDLTPADRDIDTESIAEVRRSRTFEPQSMAGTPPILWDSAEATE